MSSVNRRDFLRTGLLGSLALSSFGGVALAQAAQSRSPLERGRARNVIFLVSDGMSLGTLVLAERFHQLLSGKGTRWFGSYANPGVRRALMDTASLNSLVTDSAAASSSWGCGHRVNNGSINVAPDGTAHPTIFSLARAKGVATGLVTTATVTHATPAGFVAQVPSRASEDDIAVQYASAGMQLVLGGGARSFDAATRKDGRDLAGDFAKAGYAVVRDRSSLAASPKNKPVLGLFSSGYLPYALDRNAQPELAGAVPTLAEMTAEALSRLSSSPRGFLLQIEGARVDHGAHDNDIGALLFDQLAFDEAAGVALDFAAGRDDTLVILTSDHGNANPGLNGVGGSFTSKGGAYGATGACFDRLARFRHTNTWIMEGLTPDSTARQIGDRVKEATDLELSEDDIDLVKHALKSEYRDAYRVQSKPPIALGQILSNYVSVGWTGVAHTSDFTELVAVGPGSEGIGGVCLNTQLFTVMKEALGV